MKYYQWNTENEMKKQLNKQNTQNETSDLNEREIKNKNVHFSRGALQHKHQMSGSSRV